MENVNLPRQNKPFINRSICSYYKVLWYKSKKLCRVGNTFSVYVSDDTIKIKVSESSSPFSIKHFDDFGGYFLDIDLLLTEHSE